MVAPAILSNNVLVSSIFVGELMFTFLKTAFIMRSAAPKHARAWIPAVAAFALESLLGVVQTTFLALVGFLFMWKPNLNADGNGTRWRAEDTGNPRGGDGHWPNFGGQPEWERALIIMAFVWALGLILAEVLSVGAEGVHMYRRFFAAENVVEDENEVIVDERDGNRKHTIVRRTILVAGFCISLACFWFALFSRTNLRKLYLLFLEPPPDIFEEMESLGYHAPNVVAARLLFSFVIACQLSTLGLACFASQYLRLRAGFAVLYMNVFCGASWAWVTFRLGPWTPYHSGYTRTETPNFIFTFPVIFFVGCSLLSPAGTSFAAWGMPDAKDTLEKAHVELIELTAVGLTGPIVALGTEMYDTRVLSQAIATILPQSASMLLPFVLPFLVNEFKRLKIVFLKGAGNASLDEERGEHVGS